MTKKYNLIQIKVLCLCLCWTGLIGPVGVAQEVVRTEERFIRSDRIGGATLELRSEATLYGSEIRFGQIVRWADADQDIFEPLRQLVIARFSDKQVVRNITIQELRQLLRDAGVNTGLMNFVGAVCCTVQRVDTPLSNADKLDQLIQAQEKKEVRSNDRSLSSTDSMQNQRPDLVKTVYTLQDRLVEDLASRLKIPPETLQLTFRGEDERFLRLTDPPFRFSLNPQRVGNLGEVSWQVTITSDQGLTRTYIPARAQAWQNQVIVARPLTTKQLITDADVVERRILVDRLTEDPLLTLDQVVGQQASRDLKPGTPMTARLIDPVQLVRPGQFVTIEHGVGSVKVKMVVRAIDGGSYGQTIRVKNETTREIYRVTVTGPQTASISPVSVTQDPVAMVRPRPGD
ncbi:MAG: hypothetical protein KatS3mg104_0578 [Phycisphaerae bacterium]|nr:MAG: hypothetical protein KatS3mg104_0578 [Phycisphaerae bacterium]